jgi:hypothetical protein
MHCGRPLDRPVLPCHQALSGLLQQSLPFWFLLSGGRKDEAGCCTFSKGESLLSANLPVESLHSDAEPFLPSGALRKCPRLHRCCFCWAVAPALPSPLVLQCRGSGLAADAAVYVLPGRRGRWVPAASFDVGRVWRTHTLCSYCDVVACGCSTSVCWLLCSSVSIIGDSGHPHSGPRCGRNAGSCSTA